VFFLLLAGICVVASYVSYRTFTSPANYGHKPENESIQVLSARDTLENLHVIPEEPEPRKKRKKRSTAATVPKKRSARTKTTTPRKRKSE